MAGSSDCAWQVVINGSGETYACKESQSLLTAMIAAGRSGVRVGCRNGGCGICRIHVKGGRYVSEKMTRSRISADDEEKGIVLACRVYPRSDISLSPMPLVLKKAVA